MRVRENLSSIVSAVDKPVILPIKSIQIGRVYGVVTTKDTPTPAMFKKAGGFNGIGSVFYLDYDQAKNISGNPTDSFLDTCKIAKPLYPQFQYYPILGELIYLEDLPSAASQETSTSSQKYYISVINLWNNQQQNSPLPNGSGESIIQNSSPAKYRENRWAHSTTQPNTPEPRAMRVS